MENSIRELTPSLQTQAKEHPMKLQILSLDFSLLSGLLSPLAVAEGMGVARKADPALIWSGAQCLLSPVLPKSLKERKVPNLKKQELCTHLSRLFPSGQV